jgi:hypothetical protein
VKDCSRSSRLWVKCAQPSQWIGTIAALGVGARLRLLKPGVPTAIEPVR